MSHFTVAVFHYPEENLEEKLERYCECTEDPDFLEFDPVETREEILEYLREREDSRTPEEYADDNGYVYDPASDSYGYMQNPNAKFDYFTIGGRWGGSLRLKPEHAENASGLDSAPLAWVDTSPDPEKYKRAIREWEIVVEGKPCTDNERTPFSLYGKEYYLDQYKSKENYANSVAAFHTFAFVTPGGAWVEPGAMGWWGFDSSTHESRTNYQREFEKIIEALRDDPDIWITILDCHI